MLKISAGLTLGFGSAWMFSITRIAEGGPYDLLILVSAVEIFARVGAIGVPICFGVAVLCGPSASKRVGTLQVFTITLVALIPFSVFFGFYWIYAYGPLFDAPAQ